jgi:hypothetical protein
LNAQSDTKLAPPGTLHNNSHRQSFLIHQQFIIIITITVVSPPHAAICSPLP